jgi:hypothetical protein
MNGAAHGLHHASGDSETETQPLVVSLGREERLEDVGAYLLRDASALIGHRDGQDLPVHRRAQLDLPALRRGLDGVQQQVSQDLAQVGLLQ